MDEMGKQTDKRIRAFAEALLQTDRRLKALAETQAHTQERLNALINVVIVNHDALFKLLLKTPSILRAFIEALAAPERIAPLLSQNHLNRCHFQKRDAE